MLFSIIIPALNEEKNLLCCLASLKRLDFPADQFEVIVVDNGSTDRTVEIARGFGAKVFVLRGSTVARLRNLGASKSSGWLLAFLDADCSVPADWLKAAARYQSRSCVVAFGSRPRPDEEAGWVARTWYLVRRTPRMVMDVPWLESMNLFVRREAFIQVRAFDPRLVTCEDYDISLRLGRIGRIIADRRIVALHHGEAASLVGFLRKEFWRGTGNLHGVRRHGLTRGEFASVALPPLYLASLLAVVLCLAASLGPQPLPFAAAALALIACCQLPLLGFSFLKCRQFPAPAGTWRLHLLLNAYLLARGGAMLKRHSE